jgi:hypothetical protein
MKQTSTIRRLKKDEAVREEEAVKLLERIRELTLRRYI